jgi:hypothetical protein
MPVPTSRSSLATNHSSGQIVTSADINALATSADALEVEMLAFPLAAVLEASQRTVSFTFVLGDGGLVVPVNAAGAVTATVPPVSSVAWRAGQVIGAFQAGAGVVTIAAGAGVTILCRGKTAPFVTAGQSAELG